MDDVLKAYNKPIGFQGKGAPGEADSLVLEEIEVFQRYGFLPELMGRFARIVRFRALSAGTLKQILHENVLPQFVREFHLEGLQLSVTEGALDFIIERSLKRGTGARGLHANLVAAVEQAAFENFQRVTKAEIVIDVARGNLRSELRKRA